MMSNKIGKVGFFATLCFLSMTIVMKANAQSAASIDPKALALFDEGKALMDKNQYAEACTRFESSLKVQYGLGTLFNLSDCQEKRGLTASAWRGFRAVASATKVSGQADRSEAARARAAALEPLLSKVRIVLVGAEKVGDDLKVLVDGIIVEKERWSNATPLDPGSHKANVSVSGKVLWTGDLELREPGKEVVAMIILPSDIRGAADRATSDELGRGTNRTILASGVVATAIAAGSGIGFTIASLAQSSRGVASRGDSRDQFVGAQYMKAAYANIALWSFIGAGAAGASTVAYVLASKRSDSSVADSGVRFVFTGVGFAAIGHW